MKTKLIFLYILLGIGLTVQSQSLFMGGRVKLDSFNDYYNITVIVERIAPGYKVDTLSTDEEGNYLLEIDGGIYNIYFSKYQYFPQSILAKPIYSNFNVGTITLRAKGSLIKVPADISTVQLAIEVAEEGDTVLISEGIYKEKIIVPNKGMVIASKFILSKDTAMIAKTVIDGDFKHRVFELHGVTSPNCQIIGLTIRNGKLTWNDDNRNGAGIFCWDSNPTLKYLIIEHNENIQDGFGGGIFCLNSKPIMDHLIIRNNKSNKAGGGIYLTNSANARITNTSICNNNSGNGGGIFCRYSSPVIINSRIFDNTAISGAGMYLEDQSFAKVENVLISNNTAVYPTTPVYGEAIGGGLYFFKSGSRFNNVSIINNKAPHGSGIYLSTESSPTFTNTLVAFNKGKYGIEVNPTGNQNNPSISFCNFFANDEQNFFHCDAFIGRNVTVNINKDSCDAWNNIQADPRLSDPTAIMGGLTAGSACIDAGSNSFVTQAFDLRNIPRILAGSQNASAIVDIGYLEYDARTTEIEKIPVTDNDLQVYPNPFSSLINYRLSGENYCGRLEILDMKGKIIYSENITSNQGTVNVENLRAGIYLFRIVSKDYIKTEKIIKR